MSEVIVLVDSDETSLAQLSDYLISQNYVVQIAHNENEAAELINDLQPDLVIADVMFDDFDGFQFCETVKQDNQTRTISIILMTSQYIAGEKARALNVGASGYVGKPFDWQELSKQVELGLKRTVQMKETSLVTGLPCRYRINAEINRLVSSADSKYAVINFDLNNFQSFKETYGQEQANKLIAFLGNISSEVVSGYGGSPNFIGHNMSKADKESKWEDNFIIITEPSLIETVCTQLIKKFDRGVSELYSQPSSSSGHIKLDNYEQTNGESPELPVCTLAIGVVSSEIHKITSQWEASATASEMRVYAKRNSDKSSFDVDRRRGDQFQAVVDGGDRRRGRDHDSFESMMAMDDN